ncbi:MAG: hypothetical protein RRA92_07260, partial [Gemmatimonadota bacterium]|nr:hypothetical protein [Gemmatimonadota bacterium]
LPDTLHVGDRRLVLALDSVRAVLVVQEAGEVLIELPLAQAIDRAFARGRASGEAGLLPPDVMRVDGENDRIRISLIPRALQGRFGDAEGAGAGGGPGAGWPDAASTAVVTDLRADYLVRLAPPQPEAVP